MNKKVCILTTVHPPFDPRIFYKEAKTLVKAGYDVTLIAQHCKDEVVEGVRIIALPKPRSRFQRMFGLTWRAFRSALRTRAHVYHFHDPELIPVAIMLKLLTKARVVYDVHEDNPGYIRMKSWIPSFLRVPISILTDKIELTSARMFDAIVTADDGVASRFKIKANCKVETIYNFPPLNFFSEPRQSNQPDGSDIIYVGSLSIEHIKFMVSVGKELKKLRNDFRWCVVGVPSDLLNTFREMLRDNGLEGNYILQKRLPYYDIPQYLCKSKIGIIPLPLKPKFLKNIPTKLFEYMGWGLAVVASDLPPSRKFVGGEGCAILVRPEDVEGFACALHALLSDRRRAREMGRKGRALVWKRFHWRTEAAKLLRVYSDLVRGGGSRER